MEIIILHRKMSFLCIFCLLFQIFAPLSNPVFAIGTSFQKSLVQANVPAASEVRASNTLTVNTTPTTGETIVIGTSTITFVDIPGVDDNQLNTSSGTGYIDITYGTGDILRSTHEIAASLRSLTYVFDIGHGALVLGGSANTATFTTAGAESSPTPISFTDGTSGKISVSSSTTGALPVSAVAQVVDLSPILPLDHYVYRASIGTSTAAFVTSSSTTVKNIVEAIQPSLDAHPDVSCTENDIKITCTADVPGVEFLYTAEVVNITSLYNAINAEYSDGTSRTTYKLTEANYTSASWSAYVQSLTDAILLENNGGITDTMITDAIARIDTKKGELAIPFPHSYDITSNSTADSNIDATSYNGKVYATYQRDGNIYLKEGIGAEELVGTGTSPAIAIGPLGIPHIVYQSGANIYYKNKSSGSWSTATLISSGDSPDIDISPTGGVFIVLHTNVDYNDKENVILFTGDGIGGFSSTVIFDGFWWYDSPSGTGRYYWSPHVKVDSSGNYHIIAVFHAYDKGMGWQDHNYYIAYTTNKSGGISMDSGSAGNFGSLSLTKDSLALDSTGTPHILYNWSDGNYHIASISSSWSQTSIGAMSNPSISTDGTSLGLAYNTGIDEVRYRQDDGVGFVGSTLIDTSSLYPTVTRSNGATYIYYVKSDGTDDEVKLSATLPIFSVPGAIDNAVDSFVSSNLGNVNFSGLQIGAHYALMSGSTNVGFGTVIASSPTSSLSINPAYFTTYGKYTLTLSGSYNGTTTSSVDTVDLYIGPMDYVDLYKNQISPDLAASGIINNLTGVTYANVGDFVGLYFEKTGLGKIVFGSGMDLTNSGTTTFLQSLPSKLNIDNGLIDFNPSYSSFADYGAQLYMYFNTGSSFVSGINDPNNFVVKSSTGAFLNASDILSNIHGVCGVGEPYCMIFFDTAHFTSFDLKPFLTDVTIRSNNLYSTEYAKNGDRIILDFTGSESLPSLSVAIDGTGAASIEDLGSYHYRATSIPLDGGTGFATFSISFMDANGNNGDSVSVPTDKSSVTLDTIVPTITEHTPIVSLTDNNTPDLKISASELSTPSFSGSCSAGTGTSTIGGGINTITFYTLDDGVHSDCFITLTDGAGNRSIPLHVTSFEVDTTAPIISYEQIKDVKDTNVNLDVSFTEPNMGISPYGNVSYTNGGSSSGTANFYFSGSMASTTLSGLLPNTAYTYTVTLRDSLGNTRNSTGHFSSAIYVPGLEGNFSETGAITFGLDGDLMQGDTYNLGGNLYLYSDPSDDSSISGSLVFSGVNILASSGNWDGSLIPPTLIDPESDDAATGSEIGYGVTIVETVKVGSETAGLGAVGGYFTVSFIVPGYGSGTIFSIYRSEDGNSWVLNTPDNSCTLDAAMMCTFGTDHLSFFAPVIDTIPDAFSFAPVTNAELSTAYTSNTITVSGIATGTTISIVGGSYQIGSGAFTTLAGVVQNSETVKIRVTSSSSNSAVVNSTLNIGGVSATYSVTTKAATSGGNGGAGGASVDYCPNGDTSGSLYDNKCISSGQSNDNSGNAGGTGSSNVKPSFNDIANSFARTYIENLYASGIVSGFPNGTFRPNMAITRADWIVWVMKAYKIPLSTNTGTVFKDIPKKSAWIIPYINTAKEMGIISGQVKDGKLLFRPNASITRAEALKMLFLVARTSIDSQNKLIFVDNDFSPWMIPYVIRANELGIINGQNINRKLFFHPNASMTRGEATKMLAQILKI